MSLLSRRSAVVLFFVISGVPIALLIYWSIAMSTDSAVRQAQKGAADSAQASAVYIHERFADTASQLDFFGQRSPQTAAAILIYSEIVQRSVVFSLAILILTILYFLSRYPLRLPQNTYISSAFFSALFLSEALQLLIDSLQPLLSNFYLDSVQTAFAAVCLGAWAGLLQPEKAAAPSRVSFTSAHEAQLLEQLESLNQILARAARR